MKSNKKPKYTNDDVNKIFEKMKKQKVDWFIYRRLRLFGIIFGIIAVIIYIIKP